MIIEEETRISNYGSTKIKQRKSMSNLLAQFLSKKRSAEISEAPEIEACSDKFIVEFHSGFEKKDGASNDHVDDSDDDIGNKYSDGQSVMDIEIKKSSTVKVLDADSSSAHKSADAGDNMIKIHHMTFVHFVSSIPVL